MPHPTPHPTGQPAGRGRWWLRPPWRDPLVALAQLAFGSLLYLCGLSSLSGSDTDSVPLHVRLLVLLLGCTGSLFRSRLPLLALAVGAAAATIDLSLGETLPIAVVVADLIFAATLYGSHWMSRCQVALAVVLPTVLFVVQVVRTDELRGTFVLAVNIAAFLAIPVWWARSVRDHRTVAAVERQRAEQLATIAALDRRAAEQDRRAAVTAERTRMARDLHDVVAGHLSAIALQSGGLLSGAARDEETVRAVLASIRANSVQSLAEMRAMIEMLRAEEYADRPDPRTAPARLGDLERLLDSARASGLRVRAEAPVPDGLPAAVDLAAYRIVQEALTNVSAHAPGADVNVGLHLDYDRLVVEVTNTLPVENEVRDGSAGAGTGTGLVSMSERARAVGGRLTAGPYGRGWRVGVELPTHVGETSTRSDLPFEPLEPFEGATP